MNGIEQSFAFRQVIRANRILYATDQNLFI